MGSRHDLQTGFSLLQEPDATLAPFLIRRGLPQTDTVARLITNFRDLATLLNRHKEEQGRLKAQQVNQHRHLRTLDKGEVVFPKMPAKARAPKHLLEPPSKGPYVVVVLPGFGLACQQSSLMDSCLAGWLGGQTAFT